MCFLVFACNVSYKSKCSASSSHHHQAQLLHHGQRIKAAGSTSVCLTSERGYRLQKCEPGQARCDSAEAAAPNSVPTESRLRKSCSEKSWSETTQPIIFLLKLLLLLRKKKINLGISCSAFTLWLNKRRICASGVGSKENDFSQNDNTVLLQRFPITALKYE